MAPRIPLSAHSAPLIDSVVERVMNLPFLRAPAGMAPTRARRFRSLCALVATSIVIDVFLAAVFFWLGLPLLALTAVASMGVFTVALVVIHRDHLRVGFWIAFLDVVVHISFLAIVLGPQSGFPLYGMCLAMATFIGTAPRPVVDRLIAVSLGLLVLGMALPGWADRVPPLVDVEPDALTFLFALNLVGVAFGLVAATAWFARLVTTAEAETERQRQRSERLLLNVLPEVIAERLKNGEENIADQFEAVSVLFADIVGFTRLSMEKRTPELIEMLGRIFSEFDGLADRHGLEKIKTIGDAYMVVAGLPEPRADHASAMAEMALDMREAVRAYAAESGESIDIRIGIHSGPVVAGVIGQRKFAYDLWGDTVNVASRMESHGAPGRIQISEETRQLLGDGFVAPARGRIEVKGRGEMDTCWLEGRAGAGPSLGERAAAV
jgi:adenylate cyclase